jgi:hypothetical protein
LLLSRPPYLRWAIAALIVVAAVLWELSDRATESIPFAAELITKGSAIDENAVTWKDMPVGTIEPADLAGATATVDIAQGDPISRSVAGDGTSVPSDWWSVPLDLPPGIPVGSGVRLTLIDGSSVDGVVSLAATEDQFGMSRPGAVAVPESAVETVAVAAASDALLVVVAP